VLFESYSAGNAKAAGSYSPGKYLIDVSPVARATRGLPRTVTSTWLASNPNVLAVLYHEYIHFVQSFSMPGGLAYQLKRTEYGAAIGNNWQALQKMNPSERPKAKIKGWQDERTEWKTYKANILGVDKELVSALSGAAEWTYVADKSSNRPGFLVLPSYGSKDQKMVRLSTRVFLEGMAQAVSDLIQLGGTHQKYLVAVAESDANAIYYSIAAYLDSVSKSSPAELSQLTINFCLTCLFDPLPHVAFSRLLQFIQHAPESVLSTVRNRPGYASLIGADRNVGSDIAKTLLCLLDRTTGEQVHPNEPMAFERYFNRVALEKSIDATLSRDFLRLFMGPWDLTNSAHRLIEILKKDGSPAIMDKPGSFQTFGPDKKFERDFYHTGFRLHAVIDSIIDLHSGDAQTGCYLLNTGLCKHKSHGKPGCSSSIINLPLGPKKDACLGTQAARFMGMRSA